ncbi:MAG: tetratricopeptide repeat protein [Bacteroidales bacterium]|nr:tetratricopeptide repeat protein [Bacteroidales bacterium]
MRNKKTKNLNTNTETNPQRQQTFFVLAIILLTGLFYYNSIFNYFSLDDNYINISNEQNIKGIKAIPDIFSSLYSDNGNQAYGYRALTRATFAIEYQFTADSPYNPYVSHFINLVLYILALLVLFKVLNRLLRGYNPWFPFLVVLLFMAHPTHTEVVASIKNRDMLLHFLFSFMAIWQFVRWVDRDKVVHLVVGLLYFLLALMSKETAVVQLAVFPLVLYFFTDIKPKKLLVFIAVSATLLVLFFALRMAFLPATNRTYALMENPLVFEDSLWTRIATGFYGLGHYIKLLVIPFPLLYYYGFDMIPVVGFGNIWVILSAVVYLALLYVALINLRGKKLISFIILFYLAHLSMYANFVKPVPGIVADRFVFFASLSFAMMVVYLLFLMFKLPLKQLSAPNRSLAGIVIVIGLMLIPYGYIVHKRNAQWKTSYTLFKADMKRLDRSVKANNLYAGEIIKQVNSELSKPVNPYKFVLKLINRAEKHFLRAIELDSSHVASLNSLGVIYSRIHGNQALIREKAYIKQNRPADAAQARIESQEYFEKALFYLRQALHYDPENGSSYYNLGNTYELMAKYDSAALYYQLEIKHDGPQPVSLSRLSNMRYQSGDVTGAVDANEQIKKLYPDSYLPYINLGNYAFMAQDTTAMLENFTYAVKQGAGSEVSSFLASYYQSIGETTQANYYRNLAATAQSKKP